MFVPCQAPNPAASVRHPYRCPRHLSGSTGPSPALCALKTCARKLPPALTVPPCQADGAAVIIYHWCYFHPAPLQSCRGESRALKSSKISPGLCLQLQPPPMDQRQSITQEMSAPTWAGAECQVGHVCCGPLQLSQNNCRHCPLASFSLGIKRPAPAPQVNASWFGALGN